MSEQNLSRRSVLKGAFLSLAAIPVVSLSATAHAAPATALVDPATDPLAKGLGYVANGAAVKDPAHKAGANCANCALYQGKAKDKQGPCAIFGGRPVLAAGWCKSWVKKA